MTFSLRLIPLLPFLGAAVLILFGRRMRRESVHIVATTAIAGACLQSIVAFWRLAHLPAGEGAGAALTDHIWTWIASGDLTVPVAFRMDQLSGLLCLVVTFIGALIHVYSWGYMAHEPDHARFFAYLNLFCGAMLVLVLGDSLPLMFVGWEGVGLCSYLLIGFWYRDLANASAGKKAFITNRIGDLGFILGMLLLFQYAGGLSFDAIGEAARPDGPLTEIVWGGKSVAFWVCVLLFIGAVGKSAQIPLYVWLPDAMAGPTPVSALIHAATMVTAGVYMVARLHAVYMLTPAAMAIVAVVGAATALLAAAIGFAQNDFKKVLAYSTVSQLGFMFAGLGTGNFTGGVFHLYTHAFFKAGLFLCAGSVMHAMSGSGDITRMGGLRRKLPWTHAVFVACWLAICGIPPFAGFWSKDAIVAGAFTAGPLAAAFPWVGRFVCAALVLAAAGTAFYMSRLYFLVFSGDSRADEHTRAHIHESPGEMVGPLVVLAAGAVVAGWVGTPFKNFLGHFLEPAIGAEPEIARGIEITFVFVSIIAAGAGIALANVFYAGGFRDPARKFAARFPQLVRQARDKFGVDEMYQSAFLRPLRIGAQAIFDWVDRVIIDQVLVEGTGAVVRFLGRRAQALHSGDGQRALAIFGAGVAALVFVATRPESPTRLKVKGCADAQAFFATDTCVVDSPRVEVDATAGGQKSGRKLTYEFDFDGDGQFNRRGADGKQEFAFEGSGNYTVKVRIRDNVWPGGRSRTLVRRVRVK